MVETRKRLYMSAPGLFPKIKLFYPAGTEYRCGWSLRERFAVVGE